MRLFLALTLLVVGLSAPAALAAESPAPKPTPAPVVVPSQHPGYFLGIPRGNRVVAASMSLAFNGLGQLYNDDREKAAGMMAAWLTFPLAVGVDSLTGLSYGRLFTYLLNLSIKGWSVVDAYQGAVPSPAASLAPKN